MNKQPTVHRNSVGPFAVDKATNESHNLAHSGDGQIAPTTD